MEQITYRGRQLIAAGATWLDEGVSVVPAQPKSKKVRLPWRKYEDDPPGVNDLLYWFSSGVMNLAVICGTGGLYTLDFDNPAEYKAWCSKAGPLASTYTETSGKGYHVFYKTDLPFNRKFAECEGLGLGHLCNVSPSIHPNGNEYKVFGDPCAPILFVETAKLFSLLSDPVVNPGMSQEGVNRVYQLSKVNSKDTPQTPRDVISKIKAAFPLIDYAESLTRLRPSSIERRWFLGTCPLHADKSPSFWVDAKKQVWKCFTPSCAGRSGGDVVNLYALVKGITVHEAIKTLAREVL